MKSFLSRYDLGVLAITMILIGCCVLQVLTFSNPAIRDLVMPRFGWIGLMLGANVLIFLLPWLRDPSPSRLLRAAFMSCFIGGVNGLALLQGGTVTAVENPFHDRLPSSWGWAVGSYFLAGFYLWIVAGRQTKEDDDSATDRAISTERQDTQSVA